MAGEVRFLNYPVGKLTTTDYTEPKAANNPVIRGLPLHLGSILIANSSLVTNYLWSNAGFGGLRNLDEQLRGVEARFDPSVVPLSNESDTFSTADCTRADGLRAPPAAGKGHFHSIIDYHNAYKTGKITPTQVAESILPLIRRDLGKSAIHSTAFIDSKVDLVRKAAEASTLRYKEGKPLGVLDGVPVAIKDEVDLTGYKRTLGTKKDFTNKDDATSWCITQWIEQGIVIVGKTNMHELGLDTTNNNPNFGTPRNPYNDQYYTGGSSGGSAYAVASGLVPFALGVDGGGSIRIPASFCGQFGLKPSHSRVSTRPSSRSSVTGCGPIAANMVDLEVAFRVMANPDPEIPICASFMAPRASSSRSKKVLGIYKAWFNRADEPVKRACQAAVDYFSSKLGYKIVDITIPFIDEGQMAHAMTIMAELVSSHSSTAGFTAPNRVLMAVGGATPGTDFVRAQKLRSLIMQHLAALFTQHEDLIIVTPTSPMAGWHIAGGEADLAYGVSDGNQTIRNMTYVWLANFAGTPSITFPVGYGKPLGGEGDVPIGLMGMAAWGNENALIDWGYDGEEYLHNVLEGGRPKPNNWVDNLQA